MNAAAGNDSTLMRRGRLAQPGRRFAIPGRRHALGILLIWICGTFSALSVGVDLSVRQFANVESVGLNSNVVFSIAVTNVGTVTATGVILTNKLSPNVTFVSATSAQGSCTTNGSPGVLRCSFGNLGVSAGAAVTLTVRAAAPGYFDNLVTAGGNETDAVPSNNSVSESIPVLLFGAFMSNPQSIDLPELDSGPGDLYPSVINVSGLTTAVYNVTVILHGISHSFPDDLDVLLVAPGGYGSVMMSDSGGDGVLNGVTLTFTDSASQYLPDSGGSGPIPSGSYRPTNFGFEDNFPAPAPPPPYGVSTAFFEGINPNGAWSLYVVDDLPEDAGAITGGWSLRLTTADPIADLAVAATASSASVNVGSNLIYTVVVTNMGPASAPDVTLVDTLPSSLAFVSAIPSQGACAFVNGHLQCDLGTLTNRGQATVTFTVQPLTPGTVTELFTVSSVRYDTDSENDEVGVMTTVRALADLSLQTRPLPDTSFQGDNLTYILGGTNQGPAIATAVVLSNTLPEGVTLVSANSTRGTCSNNAGVVTCQIGMLAMGTGFAATFVVRPLNPGTLVNRAVLSAGEADFNLGNNAATNTTMVVAAANLVLRAQDQPDPGLLNQSLVYTLTTTNQGPGIATSVRLTNQLPTSVTAGLITTTQGTCTNENGIIRCQLGTLNPNEQATVTITVLPQVTGLITNLTWVGSDLADPVGSNNVAAALTTILPATDLGISIRDAVDPLPLGEILRYFIQVTNQGPHRASNVVVTNALPPQTVFVNASSSQGTCTQTVYGIRCQLGQVEVGATATMTFEIRPNSTTPVTNSVNVSALEVDPFPGNNTAREETTVLVGAGIFSSSSPLAIPVGGPANPYPATMFVSGVTVRVDAVTVTISNLSHSFVDDVDILLVGPLGQSVMLFSDCGGGNNPGNINLTFADNASEFLPDNGLLASGRFRPTNHDPGSDALPPPAPAGPFGATLSLFRNLDPNGTWSLYVFDDADKDGGQIAGGWMLSFATATEIADVGVIVQAAPLPVALMSNLTYTITVTNVGPSVATNITLTDQLPPGAVVTSIQTGAGACSNNMGIITCQLGALAAHAGTSVSIVVQLPSLGTFTNSASVGSNLIDDRIENNTAITATTVLQPVAITQQPMGRTVQRAESFTLVGGGSGGEPLQFQWLLNGSPVAGAISPTLQINNAQFTDGGSYMLRVSNGASTEQSAPAVVVVLSSPTIQTGPVSRTNFAGSSASFNVSANGTAPLSYQWFLNSTPLPTGTNAVLALPSLRLTNAGPYQVRVANEYGAVTSSIAVLTVIEADFGDAPQPGYATLLVSNAAYHVLTPGVRLGSLIDFEPDGRAGSAASGDDTSGSDDEDGVRFLSPLYMGQTATIEVVASTNGLLNAWLDYNANQSWTQSGEQIFTNLALLPGTNLLSVRIPMAATTGPSFARFRFSTLGDLPYFGPAPDGEVEDYAIPIAPLADLGVAMVDAPDPVLVGAPLLYTITITNRGPSRATLVSLSDLVPNSAAFVSAVISRGSCTVQSGTVMCSVGNMSIGESVTATITIIPNLPSTLSNTVAVTTTEGDIFPADNTATVFTIVQAAPSIVVQPVGGMYRIAAQATLSVQASGSGPLRYQWFLNGTELLQRTNATLVLTNLSTSLTGGYSVRVQNEVGSVFSGTAFLLVGDAPVVTTLAATDITIATAVLHGSVNPNGLPTQAWFEWGASASYGHITPAQSLNSSNVASIQVLLQQLPQNTPLHFRAVATNAFGVSLGADLSFSPVFDPRPRISNVTHSPDGPIRFGYVVTDQRAYVVEGSDDLIAWQNLGAGTALGEGRFEFSEMANHSFRFYRIFSSGP